MQLWASQRGSTYPLNTHLGPNKLVSCFSAPNKVVTCTRMYNQCCAKTLQATTPLDILAAPKLTSKAPTQAMMLRVVERQ